MILSLVEGQPWFALFFGHIPDISLWAPSAAAEPSTAQVPATIDKTQPLSFFPTQLPATEGWLLWPLRY